MPIILAKTSELAYVEERQHQRAKSTKTKSQNYFKSPRSETSRSPHKTPPRSPHGASPRSYHETTPRSPHKTPPRSPHRTPPRSPHKTPPRSRSPMSERSQSSRSESSEQELLPLGTPPVTPIDQPDNAPMPLPRTSSERPKSGRKTPAERPKSGHRPTSATIHYHSTSVESTGEPRNKPRLTGGNLRNRFRLAAHVVSAVRHVRRPDTNVSFTAPRPAPASPDGVARAECYSSESHEFTGQVTPSLPEECYHVIDATTSGKIQLIVC